MKQYKKTKSQFLSEVKLDSQHNLSLDLIPTSNWNYLKSLSVLKNKKKIARFSFLSAMFILGSVNFANAALSTATINSIQGDKPLFFASESIVDKLGFNYKGMDYSEKLGNIKSVDTKYFDHTTNLKDFVIKSYFTPRNAIDDVNGEYFDKNGDPFDANTPVTNTLNYVWLDSNNKKVDDADLKDIACSHNKYKMPLKLQITASNIKVHTQFGNPKESDPVNFIQTESAGKKTITKTYQIAVANTCFAKPNGILTDPTTQWRSVRNDLQENDASWNLTGMGLNGISKDKPNPYVGGGHTQDYVINQGYKVKPTVSKVPFPTTGFSGAQFQLVMGGLQQDYNYTSNNSSVTVDSNGIVTFKSKFKTAKITATLKSDKNIHYDYTFTLGLWVEPQITSTKSYADAKTQCSGGMQLLSRQDLNNASEYSTKNLDGMKGRLYNIMTRGIGKGVFGEWGRLLSQKYNSIPVSYPKTKWLFGWYYTNETHTITNENKEKITEGIVVSSHDGMISFPSAWGNDEPKRALCGVHY